MQAILAELGITAYYMSDVDRLGVTRVTEDILASLDPAACRNIHLSFDIDALDPGEAAATGTPVLGGLTLREGLTLCTALHNTGRLMTLDLTEVNPLLGDADEAAATVLAANRIVWAALGLKQ